MTNNNHHSELMTVDEVALLFRVDATTVRRWIKDGVMEAVVLPHVNARQAYRVKRSTVDAIMRGGVSESSRTANHG